MLEAGTWDPPQERHYAAQQAAATSGGSQDQQAAASEKKPDDKAQITDKVQPGQASETGKTAAGTGSAQDQKVKAVGKGGSASNPKKNVNQGKSKAQTESQESAAKTAAANPSPIHRAAAQILDSLDVALGVAQKPGTLHPSSPAGKQVNEINARRNELQQKAKAAKDDNAWSDVASGAAAALADTLKLTDENPPSAGPERIQPGSASLSSQLLLYIAGLSLAFSVLGLGCGWLLTRREINKALIEAGLV